MKPYEIKEQLLSCFPYQIELHAHTSPCSSCSEFLPHELVQAYAERGYHGLTVTNHFDPGKLSLGKDGAVNALMRDYYEAVEAGEKYGIRVYLGVEVRFSENYNDYLIYGVDEPLLGDIYDYIPEGVEAFRREVVMPNSVFLQAHPFRNNMILCDPKLLDGIECMNLHPGHNSRVAVATQYAYENDLCIKIAGGDCHHPGHQALTAMRVEKMPKDSFELAEVLKTRNYIFQIGKGSVWIP